MQYKPFIHKQTMKQIILPLVFITLTFAACDKNNDIAPKEIKLDYYTESYDLPDLGFQPQLKISYTYDNAGKLSKYTVFGFNPTSNAIEEQRSYTFTYAGGNVDKIEGFLVNSATPFIRYGYQYSTDGKVTKIIEENYSAGVNSEANFTYQPDNVVKVAYQYSNGGSFEYEMQYGNENVLADKTSRGAELCSNGVYTYDQQKNPFRMLGYVDYTLLNMSTNNKLTENVNYVGCAFPSLIPQSYTYQYNSDGYPTEATTTYTSGNALRKSQKKFFYTIK